MRLSRRLKVFSRRCNVSAAMADLAEELAGDGPASVDVVARALESLRRRLHSIEAVFWIVSGAGLRRAVHVGETAGAPPIGQVVSGATALERLRRGGTIVSGSGEVTGIEELVPQDVQSFLAVAASRAGLVTGVLILGWADTVPPCGEAAARHLSAAATLLAKALADAHHTGDDTVLHQAVLESLADRIAVVDREGTIIAVNAAWAGLGERIGVGSPAAIGPGVNYVEVCRRAAAGGSAEAATALAGIEAVCSGGIELFETTYPFRILGEERWCLMKVTPLRRSDGSAVIAHVDITRQEAMELGARFFGDFANDVPVPIWMVTPAGRLTYGNQAWVEASPGTGGGGGSAGEWLEACHPDDRDAARAALRAAVPAGARFDVEVRLKGADGTYRWWSFAAVPRFGPDGHLEGYIGMGSDAGDRHEARRVLGEVRSKLVTAQEAERGRIARELHDDLGQQLALLIARLDAVVRPRQLTRERVKTGLAEAQRGLQDLARTIHNISHELHPAKIKLLGLGPTLDALCRNISAESGIDVTLCSEGLPADLSEQSALCIFRVAQQALQNAVKHSGARRIDVHVAATPPWLTLRVTDDGEGFDAGSVHPEGLGLLTMRERVELMGGTLRIATRPGTGTTIEASIPWSVAYGAADV